MPAKHSINNKQFIFFSVAILVLLFFSFLNISNYYLTKPVLGAKTGTSLSNDDFWKEYLKNNPNYVPGWLEIGRVDKAREIDPNFRIGIEK